MPTAKLSSKYQIVLPAAIRKRLDLEAGDELLIQLEGEKVILQKAPRSYVRALVALGGALWRGYDKELDQERDAWRG